MENLAALHGPDVVSCQCQYRHCLAVRSNELDLKGPPIAITVDHGPDVARLETVLRDVPHQRDDVQFLDHNRTILPWISGDEASGIFIRFYDPDSPHHHVGPEGAAIAPSMTYLVP